MPRPLSCSTKALWMLPPDECRSVLAAAGFTHLHFDLFRGGRAGDAETAIAVWTGADGPAVLDAHGYHGGLELWSALPEERLQAVELWREHLSITARLGGDALVCHVPTRQDVSDDLVARFLDSLAALEPCARDLGLRIALENHYRPEIDRAVLPAAFERFDAGFIGFTLDPGHGLISGTLDWLLTNCCDRLTVLHLNDNDGSRDAHWIPGDTRGLAPWQRIVEVIAASPYRKPIQLEIAWDAESRPDRDVFFAEAAAAAASIDAQVEALRRV